MNGKTHWFPTLRSVLACLAVLLPLSAFAQAKADFNGDGRSDIITFVRSTKTGTGEGDVYVALSTGSGFGPGQKWHEFFCLGTEIPAVGDVNGDGRSDIISFVRSTKGGAEEGDVWVALSLGNGFVPGQKWSEWFCIGDEIPMVGDVNGDGRVDLITFVRSSKSGPQAGDVFVALSTGSGFGPGQKWSDWFCIGNEIPAVGDFNGDGRADIISFVRSTQSGAAEGDVWVALSTGSGFGPGQKWSDWFCIGGEVPLVGDFNGDRAADVATLIRGTSASGAAQGDVYVGISSRTNFTTQGGGKWHEWFCIGNEIPGVGDFNGDGRDDLITFLQDTQTGDARGNVYVCPSTGSGFSGTGSRWQAFFSIGDEVPTTASAEFPYIYFPNSNEDNDSKFVVYPSTQESRFRSAVGNFQSEFQSSWPCHQSYDGESRFLATDHLAFVDSADLAYVAGHGNVSYIVLRTNDPNDLTRCAWGSWSSHSRKGDLEYIAFQSCEVLSMAGDWRARWLCSPGKMRPFAGLHMAFGFKNIHQVSPVYPLPDEFAENLEDGFGVMWAWLEATDNENDYVWGHDNLGCAFYLRPHEFETVSQHYLPDIWYHDAAYALYARYWEY